MDQPTTQEHKIQSDQITQQTPITSATPDAQPPTPAIAIANEKPESHKKKIALISTIGVIILFLLASIYYITGVMNRTKSMNFSNITPKTTQSIFLSPTPALSSEENDVNSIDTGNPESDFTDLDQDLKSIGQ
jgi:hypothetical protein